MTMRRDLRFSEAGLQSGSGRAVYGIMAVLLILGAVGTGLVVRQIDIVAHPYFPQTMLEDHDVIGKPRVEGGSMLVDVIEEDWYPGIWRGMKEPSLYLQSREPAGEVERTIRFSWFRSFHPAMVVRLDWLKTGQVRMTAKRAAGPAGYGPSDTSATQIRVLSPAEVDRLQGVLASTAILDQPPVDYNYGGADGSRWIVEGAKPGEYRYINRWTPSERAPVNYQQMRETGLFMLGLTGWSLDPIY
jgi:hypothetical protein